MLENTVIIMVVVFALTIILMLWRPRGINEIVPTSIGAAVVLMTGIVSWGDVLGILNVVSGPSLTILSTIMMTIVLESIGLFRWIAINIVNRSRGSGIRLYIYTNLLCFLMTMLFNNDGSILITTPIIIHIITMLKLNPRQFSPYLISGAIIATAASAPIAVSNISNLIALEIVGLSLNSYVYMMFVPSMIGILTIYYLMYLYYKRNIPRKIFSPYSKTDTGHSRFWQSHQIGMKEENEHIDWDSIKISIVIVVATRACFFAFAPFGIPTEWIGLVGATVLIILRWFKMRTTPVDIFKKTPWHILLFAFNMYVLVYGLRNIGLNDFIVDLLRETIVQGTLNATFVMGFVSTLLSNLFNNLPAVMIATLSITDMNLDPMLLKITYLANVIGADIGALLTPIGTLATLIWMYELKKHSIKMTWRQYLRVTVFVIPIGLIVSLFCLYVWVSLLFN